MLVTGLLYLPHCFYHITTCKIAASRGNTSVPAPELPVCNGSAERARAMGSTLTVAEDFSPRHSGACTLVFLTTILLNVVVFVGLSTSLY